MYIDIHNLKWMHLPFLMMEFVMKVEKGMLLEGFIFFGFVVIFCRWIEVKGLGLKVIALKLA